MQEPFKKYCFESLFQCVMLLRSPPCLSVYHCYISHPVSVCNAVTVLTLFKCAPVLLLSLTIQGQKQSNLKLFVTRELFPQAF
uniref:Uncharacterized protein n=1 Tax=Anguilla anguilla TaxID=7936 RepID=A0A0E9Q2V8_ANGAN